LVTVAVDVPTRNLTRLSEQQDWVVCGWFTDDPIYRGYAQDLAASLDKVDAPYDLVAVDGLSGGWEANTRAKPAQVLAAMDRHRDKTVVFMDVDFTAVGDLSPLIAAVGDFALKMGARRRRNGSVRLAPSSQVMVVKPTEGARNLVSTWVEMGRKPQVGETDEALLCLALGACNSCTFSTIDQAWLNTVLVHHWANKKLSRIGGFRREVTNVLLWIARTALPRSAR
jgi:hypothetical protein